MADINELQPISENEEKMNALLKSLTDEGFQTQIANGIARVKEVRAQVVEFRKEGEAITIENMEDKEGYNKTKLFLGKVRPTRTALDGERKITVRPFNDMAKAVNGLYDGCIEELAEIEAPHKLKKKEYDDFQEAQKQKKLEEDEAALNKKIARLMDAGLEYVPASGYYKNDMGIAVTRLDVLNMSEEDFEALEKRALDRKTEIEKEKIKEQERKQKLEVRKSEILSAGMNGGITGYVLQQNRTQSSLTVSFEDFELLDDEKFSVLKGKAEEIVKDNTLYKTELDNKQIEQDKKDKELRDREENLKRQQVQMFSQQLEAIGFKYTHGNTIEEGSFYFTNPEGNHTLKVADALANYENVTAAIKIANEFKDNHEFNEKEVVKQRVFQTRLSLMIGNGMEQNETSVFFTDGLSFTKERILNADEAAFGVIKQDVAAEQLRLKAAADKKEQDRLDTEKKEKEQAEARKKVRSKKDLQFIDKPLSEIVSNLEIIEKRMFEVIGEYADGLTADIKAAIEKFNKSTTHLRQSE